MEIPNIFKNLLDLSLWNSCSSHLVNVMVFVHSTFFLLYNEIFVIVNLRISFFIIHSKSLLYEYLQTRKFNVNICICDGIINTFWIY